MVSDKCPKHASHTFVDHFGKVKASKVYLIKLQYFRAFCCDIDFLRKACLHREKNISLVQSIEALNVHVTFLSSFLCSVYIYLQKCQKHGASFSN